MRERLLVLCLGVLIAGTFLMNCGSDQNQCEDYCSSICNKAYECAQGFTLQDRTDCNNLCVDIVKDVNPLTEEECQQEKDARMALNCTDFIRYWNTYHAKEPFVVK